MRRRVVITGLGAITPIGHGADGLWSGVRRGRPATRAITRFDASAFRSRVAAEIDGFDPLDHIDARVARRLDRFSQLAVAAGGQALADARLCVEDDGDDMAIVIGSALGGVAYGEENHQRYLAGGLRATDPLLALTVFGAAGATNVAIAFGLRGPVLGNNNSCSSGLMAIGEAARLIRAGVVETALAGGAEAPLAPLTFGAFARIKAMSTRNDEPAGACRPFDRARDGFVMGEGAAAVALESLEHARRRGARPYAEVLGYGATNDAYHMTAPLPSGVQAARAMTLALADAGLRPDQVDYLNAHATGTPLGDSAEALAIRLAFGEAAVRLPVSGVKGLFGHPLGASGAIELAITVLALRAGWLPPTANLADPDPECCLRHIPPCGRGQAAEVAVTNSFGFGGINASLALRHWSDDLERA
jgi:3-oxoacyl-[acyl-carrier-protein] synthase II